MPLSLTAESLLLSIHPSQGGLVVDERDLQTALGVASETDGQSRGGSAAKRAASRELAEAGLIVKPRLFRRLRLADSTGAAQRFDGVKRGATTGELASDRDRQLLVVLAACGTLAARLDRDERRAAREQLGALLHDPDDSTRHLIAGLSRNGPFVAKGFPGFDSQPGPDIAKHPNRPDPNSVAGALTWDSDPQGGKDWGGDTKR